MQHTRTFSNWARSPATGLNVSTHSGAAGGQLHLALGLSFVEAASPASPRPLSSAPGGCGPHLRLPFPPASSSEDLETPGAQTNSILEEPFPKLASLRSPPQTWPPPETFLL